MRVLITGAQGYIGGVLGPRLLDRGHDVQGMDSGLYRDGRQFDPSRQRLASRTLDIRRVQPEDLAGFEAVVHLAELSNDPLSDMNPPTTHDINHRGSVMLARLCKQAGVARFVYASSCSVYGTLDGGDDRDEQSATQPMTTYSVCKALVERDVGALADDGFSPVFLRNATAYGPSPHMRFDIVLNNLCGLAWTTKVIAMTSDGTPWRPLVHVDDICEAMALVLEAPRERVHNEIFNVGDDAEQYRIRDIARIVGEAFADCAISFGSRGGSSPSYRASFQKVRRHLPEFRCRWSARDGASQLREMFARIGLTKAMFLERAHNRYEQVKHLLETNQVDDGLFWRLPADETSGPSP